MEARDVTPAARGYLSRIEDLETRIEVQRARIRQLEALVVKPTEFRVPHEWKLTPYEARMFQALLNSEVCTRERALFFLYGDRLESEQPYPGVINVVVYKLRMKLSLAGIVIHTVWEGGFRLDPEQRAAMLRDELPRPMLVEFPRRRRGWGRGDEGDEVEAPEGAHNG